MGPLADLKKGCEQIGRDYVVSWRPSCVPVTTGFYEQNIRKIIRQGLKDSRGCNIEILLKEMMTVLGDLSRLFRWTEIAQAEADAI